jgi:hypothetical protein
MSQLVNRLDAPQTVFFERQLETIESRAFQMDLPDLKARSLIPSIPGINPADAVYTYHRYSGSGSAKRITTGNSTDLPASEATAEKLTSTIQRYANSFNYTIFEIQAAARANAPLEQQRAMYARRGLEELVDQVLADGKDLNGVATGLDGLLSVSGNSYTLCTKVAGGLTWGTVGAPNATALEILQDLMGIVAARIDATKGKYSRFDIVLPQAQYNLAATLPLGDDASLTPLKFALQNDTGIASVTPWHKCTGAGAGGTTNRMVCYPKDPMVLGAAVPQEFAALAPQLDVFQYNIPCHMSTGGVILYRPVAMSYADGL